LNYYFLVVPYFSFGVYFCFAVRAAAMGKIIVILILVSCSVIKLFFYFATPKPLKGKGYFRLLVPMIHLLFPFRLRRELSRTGLGVSPLKVKRIRTIIISTIENDG